MLSLHIRFREMYQERAGEHSRPIHHSQSHESEGKVVIFLGAKDGNV